MTTTRRTTLYMDAEKLRALKILAARRDTTLTALITRAVDEFLEAERAREEADGDGARREP